MAATASGCGMGSGAETAQYPLRVQSQRSVYPGGAVLRQVSHSKLWLLLAACQWLPPNGHAKCKWTRALSHDQGWLQL